MKSNAAAEPLHAKSVKVPHTVVKGAAEKPIALKRKPARPHVLGYLLPVVPEEGEEMVESYMVSHAGGLEVTTIRLANGEKIVYNDFGGIGEIHYYNAQGHCYMTVEE